MLTKDIKDHLEALGVSLTRLDHPNDGRKWSTTLHGRANEAILFSSASHALRYWDVKSRAQLPALCALEARARSGISNEDIVALEDWILHKLQPPEFMNSAFGTSPPEPPPLSRSDMRKLCKIYGPISSSWIASFIELSKRGIAEVHGIHLDPDRLRGRASDGGNKP